MRSILIFIFLLVSSSIFSQGFDDIIIDQEQFKVLQNNEGVIVLHVGYDDGYMNGHIPGAIYINSRDFTTTSHDSLYWELPEKESFATELKKRGINNQSQIILCADWESFAPAFRLYFTFDYFSLADHVKILDGGIKGWSAKDLLVQSDTVVAIPSNDELNLIENPELLVDKNWIKDNLGNNKVSIVDARTPEYFSGEKDGDGHYKRPGHISGSKNITWRTLVDDNHFLIDKKSLKSRFDDAGIKKNQSVINYCHVGLRASMLYTIGKCLEYNTLLYDGSYNEWDRLGDEFPSEMSKD